MISVGVARRPTQTDAESWLKPAGRSSGAPGNARGRRTAGVGVKRDGDNKRGKNRSRERERERGLSKHYIDFDGDMLILVIGG